MDEQRNHRWTRLAALIFIVIIYSGYYSYLKKVAKQSVIEPLEQIDHWGREDSIHW